MMSYKQNIDLFIGHLVSSPTQGNEKDLNEHMNELQKINEEFKEKDSSSSPPPSPSKEKNEKVIESPLDQTKKFVPLSFDEDIDDEDKEIISEEKKESIQEKKEIITEEKNDEIMNITIDGSLEIFINEKLLKIKQVKEKITNVEITKDTLLLKSENNKILYKKSLSSQERQSIMVKQQKKPRTFIQFFLFLSLWFNFFIIFLFFFKSIEIISSLE